MGDRQAPARPGSKKATTATCRQARQRPSAPVTRVGGTRHRTRVRLMFIITCRDTCWYYPPVPSKVRRLLREKPTAFLLTATLITITVVPSTTSAPARCGREDSEPANIVEDREANQRQRTDTLAQRGDPTAAGLDVGVSLVFGLGPYVRSGQRAFSPTSP